MIDPSNSAYHARIQTNGGTVRGVSDFGGTLFSDVFQDSVLNPVSGENNSGCSIGVRS